MNSTNRAFNRILILVAGLLLLAVGLVGVALAALPAAGREWRVTATAVSAGAPSWVASPAVGSASAAAIGIGVVAVLLVILLIVFIARQGRGHTDTLVERADGAGATILELGVPKALLAEDLAGRPEFVAARVSAYRVRRTPTLKVSVQCRRGVAPTDATAIVTRSLQGMDEIVGTSIPALIQVSGGFRTRVSGRSRRS